MRGEGLKRDGEKLISRQRGSTDKKHKNKRPTNIRQNQVVRFSKIHPPSFICDQHCMGCLLKETSGCSFFTTCFVTLCSSHNSGEGGMMVGDSILILQAQSVFDINQQKLLTEQVRRKDNNTGTSG